MTKRTFLASAILVLAQSYAYGQQDDCSKALILDTFNESSESQRDYRFSQYISEKQFSDFKQNIVGSGTAILYGIPVSASTTYIEYKTQSSELLKKVDIAFTEHEAWNVAWVRMSDNSSLNYRACLQGRTSGLFLDVARATKDQVELTLQYRS